MAIWALLPRTAHAVADQFVYYFGNSTSTGGYTPQLGGYTYNPATQTFYTAALAGQGQALNSITNTSSGWITNLLVGQTDWLNFIEDDNVAAGHQPAGVSAVLPTPGGMLLNPTTLTVGGITYAPDTLGIVVDGTKTRVNNSLVPADSKLVYAYDLRAVTYDNIGNYNAPALPGTRDYNGDGIIEGNDVFYPIVSFADQQTLNPNTVTTNGSNSVARQFAFSTDGQSIYFTDASSAYGGLYKVKLTATGSSAISKILTSVNGTPINCEPAVVPTTLRNLGSGFTGDQILFAGSTDVGNVGGVNYIVDTGSGYSPVSTLLTAKQASWFLDYSGATANVQSITADPTGTIYLENSNLSYGGIFQLDSSGRMAKVYSGAEQATFDSQNGASYQANSYKTQITNGSSGATYQLMYKDYGLQSPVGVNLFKPGDFNHDGVINATDIAAFKAHLGLRGAIAGYIPAATGSTPINGDYFTYNLTGSYKTTINGTSAYAVSVDWKDAMIFAQYAGLSNGDVNMDGVVNQTDFNTLASNYNTDGKIWTDGNIDSVRINAPDKDMVNFGDMVTLAANYPAGSKPVITGYGTAVQTDADRAFAITANGTISQLMSINFNGATLNWADAGNWSNGVPNAAGAVASLLTKPENDTTINIASSETVGQLNFDNYFKYTLSGSGTLHLAGNNNTTAEINTFAASPLISTAISLDSSTNITITYATDTATFSGPIGGIGSLTKIGLGTVLLSATNSYAGNTTVSAGTLQAVSSGSLPGFNAAGKVSVLFGGLLVASTGGMNEWNGTDLDALRSNATFATGAMLGFDTTNSAGQVTYGSNVSGVLGLTKLGANTLFLAGTNGYSGGTTISAGTLEASYPASLPGYSTSGKVTVNSGGSVAVSVAAGHWNAGSIASLLSAVTFNSGSSFGIDTAGATGGFIYSGNITGNQGLAKIGANTLTLTNANSYAGTTNVSDGTLQLSFSGSATISNILPAATTLILIGNGSFSVTGIPNSTTALSQTFTTASLTTGTILNPGSAGIIVNDYSNSSNGYAGAPINLTFGSVIRNTGSTVDFTLPGNPSSTIAFGASTSSNIFGGWATVGQSDWASNSNNNVIALPSYSYTNDTWSSGNNTTITTSSSPTTASTTNSLRFNLPAANTLTLSGVNTINSGGILVTPSVVGNNTLITGGTLIGAKGTDLVVNQFDTTGNFTIGSVIADNTTATALTKAGNGTLMLTASNTYTGSTFINAGKLQISSGSINSPSINVLSGASLNVVPLSGLSSSASVTTTGTVTFKGNSATTGSPAGLTLSSISIGNGGFVGIADPGADNHANRTVLVTSNLFFSGGTDSWNGTLDLAGNDMIVHGGSLANFTNQIKSGYNSGNWNGTGIASSTAAADANHLTALGVISNNNAGQPLYSIFDGQAVTSSDLLVKYTYYGDANLDGKVDGSDYSKIDNGYLNHLTGWGNGDFNYDGVVNGTDYTLMDNAFNRQGASLGSLPYLLVGSAYYLKLDTTGPLDIWSNSTATGTPTQVSLALINTISVTGTGTVTSLTVDFSNGNAVPAAGVSYIAPVGGQNTLKVIAPVGSNVATVNGTGVTVSSSYNSTITYSNATAIVFTGNGTGDVLNQTAQPGNGASLVFANMTSSDTLNVSGGTFTFSKPVGPGITAQNLGTLLVGAGAKVIDPAASSQANRWVLVVNSLTIAGTNNAWTGQLDLAGDDLVVHNGSLATITNQIKSGFNTSGSWTGAGIDSDTAAANTTHITALGVILNSTGTKPIYGSGTAAGLFDGLTNTTMTDVLVKYTYYGDTNLDGKVDGSDYSRIDAAYLADKSNPSALTGWYNGDFNYDGVINGTDYTLIDNAFNTQGAPLAAQIAAATAQIPDVGASSAVPEPTVIGLVGIGMTGLLGRRNRSTRTTAARHCG